MIQQLIYNNISSSVGKSQGIGANILTIFLIIILYAIIFFIVSALIMVTYNKSITKMNSSWSRIDYPTAMAFTVFIWCL